MEVTEFGSFKNLQLTSALGAHDYFDELSHVFLILRIGFSILRNGTIGHIRFASNSYRTI
jgi:hypothetical protein